MTLTHRVVASRSTAARLAWDAALGLLLAPSCGVLLAVLLALGVWSAVLAGSITAAVVVVGTVAVIVVLLLPALALLTWRSTRRLAPPGTSLGLALGDTAMVVSDARGSVTVDYRSIRRVRVVGATALVQLDRRGSVLVLPAALVGSDFGRLRALAGR